MTLTQEIELAVEKIPTGIVFSVRDLNLPHAYKPNVIAKLNRMVKSGLLHRLTRGKYYKAEESVFGKTLPSTEELLKDLLYQNGEITGYITGYNVWASMQLTTQFSVNITIGTNGRKASLVRAGQRITFINQPNKITRENIKLLQILDAIKFIKRIPDTSAEASIIVLKAMIHDLMEKDIKSIVKLSMKYPPRVRALLGAIIDAIIDKRKHSEFIKNVKDLNLSLNPLSSYRLGLQGVISEISNIGLNLTKWHIK